jgi:hypothetical protein
MRYGRDGKLSTCGTEESVTYGHNNRPEATNPTLTAIIFLSS